MITLSGFGYEESLTSPYNAFTETWKRKSFISGPSVKEFEDRFKHFVGAEDCVAVSSCTSALQLSLLALSIGPGDEVITVPYTWVSTVEAIVQVGAKPVFVDINPDDLCIETKTLGNAITPNTKAIIPVDLFGNVADIDELKKYQLPIIQDSAQSVGAKYKGKRVGSLSDLTCFSFYPTKNLGSWGDAGAVTGSKTYCAKIRELRNHGQSKKFDIKTIGWNARMDSIQAEVLTNKLPLLDQHNKRRREIAQYYDSELKDTVKIPLQNTNSMHVYHQYVIQSTKAAQIKKALNENGIQSRNYYPVPLNQLPPYFTNQKFPHSQYAGAYGLAIPVHQYLTNDEVKFIIKTIKDSI
jgi:UDP-2-acetamido-2-deoxy-ribo-hexuluronate aminotransferase